MNIRYVGMADFRRSELTNLNILFQERPELKNLGKSDGIMFINYAHTQLVVILGIYVVEMKGVRTARYVRSERARMLDNEKWNPLLMSAYDSQAGLGLSLPSQRAIAKVLEPVKGYLLDQIKSGWNKAA